MGRYKPNASFKPCFADLTEIQGVCRPLCIEMNVTFKISTSERNPHPPLLKATSWVFLRPGNSLLVLGWIMPMKKDFCLYCSSSSPKQNTLHQLKQHVKDFNLQTYADKIACPCQNCCAVQYFRCGAGKLSKEPYSFDIAYGCLFPWISLPHLHYFPGKFLRIAIPIKL